VAESITYDFISRGADRLAGDFRKTGDSAAAAARGAKVLQDVIGRLGEKENRTAAESANLARALRLTGDAEDRAAAKAVLADAAIRRLDDAMKDSSRHSGELGKALGGLKLNPGLLGPALALAPAIATLAGVVTGAAIGLGGAFVAGGASLAAFGAVAKPVLTDAKTAATAVETAQNNYNAAIAGGTKKAVAYKAEQIAIAKAYAGLSPAQIALSKQLGAMANSWDAVKAAETPVVAGALQPWLKSVTDLTGKLGPVIAAVSPYIADLGRSFDGLVNSGAFTQFRDFVASAGSSAVGAAGHTLIDFVKAFMILLPKFDPLIAGATRGISQLGPAVLKWASSKKTADDITKFMAWFSQNGPAAGALLKNIGAALAALAPGLGPASVAEMNVISGFFGFIAKLPPSLAKPLLEVAGAMLILNKIGVVKVGISLVGTGAGAAGSIGAKAAGGAAAGTGAAAAGGGAAAAGAGATAVGAGLIAGGAAIAAGLILRIREDMQAGWKQIIADIPKALSGTGGILQLASRGWADLLMKPVQGRIRGFWVAVEHDTANEFDNIRHDMARWSADAVHAVASTFDAGRHEIANIWNGLLRDLENIGLSIEKFLLTRFRDLGSGILNIIGGMINGLAKAFGWLPFGVGSSLRKAASNFDSFRAHFNSGINDQIGHISAMQRTINSLHGKTVNVLLHAAGSGSIYFNESTGVGGSVKGGLKFFARGGTGPALAVVGEQGPELVSLPPGARVYSHGQSAAMIPGIPGFAAGGYVPNYAGAENWMGGSEYGFGRRVENSYAVRLIRQLHTAVAAAAAAAKAKAALNYLPLGPQGPLSASAAVAQAFARSILFAYGWGQNQFPPLQALWNEESGWNSYAVNASSGAYGIPQALGKGHPYNLGDYQAQVRWGLAYISSRYGSPSAAYAFENSHTPHWYDRGGWLQPGLTLAYNGTGRPEQVIPAGGGRAGTVILEFAGTGSGTFDAFLLKWIRENVRVKGGGSVQTAFGR